MIELDSVVTVLRRTSDLYWLLAIVVVALAVWLGRTWRAKTMWGLIAVAVFSLIPVQEVVEHSKQDAYAREAWSYFKKKCDTEAGEKIYKSYTGVNSVLVIKPLPSASDKDHSDQFWKGDPYSASATSKRAESAAIRLATDWKHRAGMGTQKGLEFVEMRDESGNGYIRINRPLANDKRAVRVHIEHPTSRFGVAWEDVSTTDDRKYWVAASRLRVVDLTDNSIVAERIGFLIEAGFGSSAGGRRPWLTARGLGHNGRSCPNAHDATDQWFITAVFKQDSEK